jgi:hypothetical protein
MSRATATGTGNARQIGFRPTATNRDGLDAYALHTGQSVNSVINQAVAELLTRAAKAAVRTIGTTRGTA